MSESAHSRVLELFKYYLLSGGLPDAVKAFVEEQNVPQPRRVQEETRDFYAMDASQYGGEWKLHIREMYDLILR